MLAGAFLVAVTVSCMPSFTMADAASVFGGACQIPRTAPLAFAGNATRAQLGLPDRFGSLESKEVVYAVVSRDRVPIQPNIGPQFFARSICYASGEGVGQASLEDDWHFPMK